ncbi:unnamed protein product [Parnassius mnemosyne]|uniref:Cadherin domain-containing protein n=1 Tax=Parnassius mnemosyne TaxID=213953 RepID=A0AAV1LYG4_9NEOP
MAFLLWISALAILAPPVRLQGNGARESGAAQPSLAIALSMRSRAIQDSRCYLMNGGAVESFFISEDTPVGSVIGTLSVNGDPSPTGDISLSVQEREAALRIPAGSKNLTLARALDREQRAGPASLYVNVRCDRRGTTDPSFIIPVSVRVWDVNDNAPEWIGAPYEARVSELASVGSRVLAAPARDADQPGPHATVHYVVLPGPHSEFIGFANELDSTLVVKKPLDYEKVRNFTLTLRAQDAGTPPRYSDTQLTVRVLDADDQNPKFTHDHYTALVPDDVQEGTILKTSPGPIAAADQDVGINAPLYYSVASEAGGAALVRVERESGRVAAAAALHLADLPATIVIKATQVDNADRYALAALELSRAAPRRVRFLRRAYSARVREDAAPGALLLALHTTPPQTPLQFYVSDKSFLDKFAINSAGEVLLKKSLDYETTDSYNYQVMVTDGVSNDTAAVNITVLNVNEWEPRFRFPHYEFQLDTDAMEDESGDVAASGLVAVGQLEVHDGDRADSVSLTLHGTHAPLFYINDSGEMFLRREALATMNSSVLHVVATAIDSGDPPRQTSVPVSVRVVGRGWGAMGGAQDGFVGPRGVALGALGAALALLALFVLVLLLYICRRRRRRSKNDSASALTLPPEEPPSTMGVGSVGSTGGGRNAGSAGSAGSAGEAAAGGARAESPRSVSAGASTILAGSTASLDPADTGHYPPHVLFINYNGDKRTRSPPDGVPVNRQSQRFPAKSKVAPAPPVLTNGTALMSDHLHARGAGRSGVAWPSATIPARVKKLSWDDAQGSAERVEVNEATNSAVAENMNLTVYF